MLARWWKSLWIPKNAHDLQWFVRVNPDLTSSLGQENEYRQIAPASQPSVAKEPVLYYLYLFILYQEIKCWDFKELLLQQRQSSGVSADAKVL